jgi:Lrp/AsnC family leucine-responsive transcriptional regulator
MSIDATDKNILRLLQQDAKMKIKEIAASLNMTSTPIFERIKRLEKTGYIERYTAIVNKEKVGFGLIVLCSVSLQTHDVDIIEEFERDIQKLSEVIECYHTTGEADYLLKIIVRDMQSYQHFVSKKLAALNNIGRVQSSFVINEIKNATHLPEL